MSTTAVPLLSLAGSGVYLFAGWKVARYRLPVMWRIARELYIGSPAVERSVRVQFLWTWIAWPHMLTYTWTKRVWNRMMVGIDGAISTGDPQARVNQLEQTIAQLEAWHKRWELDNKISPDCPCNYGGYSESPGEHASIA